MTEENIRQEMAEAPDGIPEETPKEEPKTAPPEAATETAAEAPAEEPAMVPLQALEEAKAQAQEYLSMAKRTKADYENYRRRTETIHAEAYAEGRNAVMAAMLPVLDNLERAVAAAREESPLKSGVEMTLRQMREACTHLGLEEINRLGQPFDPNLEEAVLQGAPEDGEPGTVCQVLQKGYRLGNGVLRHAMVKVVPEA